MPQRDKHNDDSCVSNDAMTSKSNKLNQNSPETIFSLLQNNTENETLSAWIFQSSLPKSLYLVLLGLCIWS